MIPFGSLHHTKSLTKVYERRLVKTKTNKDALLVTYTSGGTTPGDSYLWHLDASGKPESYQMWVSILPIGGLEGYLGKLDYYGKWGTIANIS